MGSAGSRGKKVAPESMNETRVDGERRNRRGDPDSFSPNKIQELSDLSQPRDRARPVCHSDGHLSEFFGDGDDVTDAELDRVLAVYEGSRAMPGEISRKSSVSRCETYEFCRGGREYKGSDFRGSLHSHNSEVSKEKARHCNVGDEVDVKKDSLYSQHCRTALYVPDMRSGGLRKKDNFQDYSFTKETASVPGTCEVTSNMMPVIQYNRSEEDLMDTIEREFS